MSKSNSSKKISRDKTHPVKGAVVARSAKAARFIDIDRRISAMAKRGELTYAGESAFKRSLKKGLSVTVIEDDGIYKVNPDGTKIRVKKQSQVYRDSKTGKFYTKK